MGRLSAMFILVVGLSIICGPLTADLNPAATEPQKDFKELVGRWVRNDAGYVIEIKSIDDEGKMEAAYYNPRPIYVSVAKATVENNGVKVFIELRDVGYPGSTYTLTYVPRHKVLVGLYYQATLRQNFEVLFTKMD